jgi:ferritin-like metal-binding protein YciE
MRIEARTRGETGMPKRVEGLEQLLVTELQDLYDAEKQLVKALPKMAKSATDEELENAFRQHLEVTKEQVQRLEQVFESMEMRARSRPCKAMKGLVEEGQEVMQVEHEPGILDSGLTSAGRKVEHYEMAGYDSAWSLARQLGMREAADLLQRTLREEMETDKQLAQISKRLLKEAGRPGMASSPAAESGRSASSRGSSRGAQSRTRSSSRRSSLTRNSSSARSSRGGRSSAPSGRTSRSARPLTDHDAIRQWAEERGAQPACVRGTGGRGDTGMIRLDFPGYTGEESLEHIAWDDWFQKFDENNLALLVRGDNFNKLVSREGGSRRVKPKTRGAH